MKTKDYNSIKWEDHFYLDETSPSGLRWVNSPRNGIIAKSVAGNMFYKKTGQKSAWQVMLHNKSYVVHRVIWVMLYKSISTDLVIDHLNGDPFDNRLTNICIKTAKSNNQNKAQHKNNKTGHTGVCIDVKACGFTYFCATWSCLEGKQRCKRFRVEHLGYDQAKQMAIDYRNLQIQLLNAAGASYTERHQGIPSTT